MKDEAPEQRRDLQWALPASLILHALIIALLIHGLPRSHEQPPEEQPINVTLVPPPDPPMPAPAPQPAEEKAEEPPAPKVEKSPEQSAQEPPPEEQLPDQAQIEVLKPVFQFGDNDTGPRESLDGASAEDNTPTPAKDGEDTEDKPVAATGPDGQADAAEDGDQQATEASEAEPPQPVEEPAQPVEVPEPPQDADSRQSEQIAAAAPTLPDDSSLGQIDLPLSADIPQPRPANAPKPSPAKAPKSASAPGERSSSADTAVVASQGYTGLPGVRKRGLFSQGATGDELAATSMAGVPRGERVARLCASALHRQLVDASYFPDLVPLVPLKEGTVLNVPETAFHARRIWFQLSFRCEIDSDATRVLSLTYSAGNSIPPDQWARLGLPVRR